jgi:hypothetical protein
MADASAEKFHWVLRRPDPLAIQQQIESNDSTSG